MQRLHCVAVLAIRQLVRVTRALPCVRITTFRADRLAGQGQSPKTSCNPKRPQFNWMRLFNGL